MDKISKFREYTRQLEFQLANMSKKDCCCCNISTAQCFMLVEIGRRPGISLKELATILKMDKGGVSRSIEDLVRKEYVERKTSEEDRRWIALFLLQKGQEHFEKIERDMNSKFQDILNEIPEEKQNQVIEALQLYVGACKKVEEQKND